MPTETEINFYKHFNWECWTFVNGPAKQWLKKYEIPEPEFTRIYLRIQNTGVHTFLVEEPLIEPPMEYPWKDANEFWTRHRELSDR